MEQPTYREYNLLSLKVSHFECEDQDLHFFLRTTIPREFVGIGFFDDPSKYMDKINDHINLDNRVKLMRSEETWSDFNCCHHNTRLKENEHLNVYCILLVKDKTTGERMYLHLAMILNYI
jgi:hypothetical protein